jgi:hypothetical protein
MSIQQEIKSQLAKLLATEDLIVEHKQVETASFNVESRVLVLPLWEKASSEVYDMLVAHEVGHALFTPCEDWLDRYDIPPSFVNIVEDARIEKLMKRKYAGLPKTFFTGYKELQGMDFFKLSDIDVNEMGIADRLNLYFKVGNFIDIDFTDYEKTLVSMVKSAETFDDVLEYSKVIWEYAKEELEQKKKEQQEIEEMKAKVEMEDGDGDNEKEYKTTTQGTEGDSEKSDVESEDELEDEDEDDDDGLDYDDQSYSKGGITLGDEPKAETVENLEESLKDLVNEAGRETLYVEKPNDLDLDKVIIPNWFIHKNIDFEWRENTASDFFNADREFDEFRVSARKEVNYLVKEFEMKKSASAYARAATARTGMLDMSKLHTYQYCEDIFKKVTVLPDGKNHGLVFILDWSGSMSYIMKDTIKQLYNLIWFCRKVQIPFDVYAFTNCHPYHNMRESRYTAKNNIVCIEESFSLMNLFTSKVNARTLDHQMRNIYRMATRFGYSHVSWDDRDRFQVPLGMGLSGTPLDESLICLHQIIPQFKKDNKVEKVQCVVLTDGEAYTPSFHNEVQRHWEDEPYMGRAAIWSGTFLRDRKLGKTYRVKDSTFGFTEVLLDNLKDTFPSVNFIGIRLLGSRDAGSFIRRYHGWTDEEYNKIMKGWKKNRSVSIKTSAYDTYFGLSTTALASEDEFEVKEDATKAEIKRAFGKSLKGKKMNKKILSEFIELVA